MVKLTGKREWQGKMPSMTEKERKKQIAYHRAALRELGSVPRSRWHAGFEALLRIEIHEYGSRVHLKTEEVLGEEPPRADYVVLIEDEETVFDKSIFKIFRKHNICEYKNPRDSLRESTLRKICGYANLYIGIAEHEGDIPSDQVTISIFRAVKNPRLFRELEKAGKLKKDETPGIYNVVGFTDLPFQIVITSELEGDEYAAYRALTNKADEEDIERVIKEGGKAKDDTVREHYRVLLKLLLEKNPEALETIRRENDMEDVLMEIVKDKVEERVNNAVSDAVSNAEAAKEQETLLTSIRNIMNNLKLSLDQAMDALNIPQGQRSMYANLIKKS